MSEYYNPIRESFKQAKKLDSLSFYILITSAILTLINFIFTKYISDFKYVSEIASTANTVIVLLYGILKFGISYIIFHTSIDKRADFIDHSFGTNYSADRSNRYYNNETVETGILRMGANSFESCFFTYNLSLKLLKSKWAVNLGIIVFIISIALQGYNTILSMVIQLTLPIFLISDAINHSIFCLRMKSILDSYCRLYNDLIGESDIRKKEPEVILLVLNYETTLATFSLLVSEHTYNKYNPKLSDDWEKIKEQYKLN